MSLKNLREKLIQYTPTFKGAWHHREKILWVSLAFFVWLYFSRPTKTEVITVEDKELFQQLTKERARNGQFYSSMIQERLSKEAAEKRSDSLARLLKIKPKFIEGVTVYTTKIDTIFKEKTVHVFPDSLNPTNPTYIATHKDRWIDLGVKINKDSAAFSLMVRDTPRIVQYHKNPIIGRSKYTTIVYSSNPYVQQEKGYSYTTKPKEPFLTIGPVLSYDFFTRKPSIGFGVQIPIIKIKK